MKWINDEVFDTWLKKREEEKAAFSYDDSWVPKERGTTTDPKVYEGRFLLDTAGIGYKKFFYHMFQDGESWKFVMCPKTFDFNAFCPYCFSAMKLYQGSESDKKLAGKYKRKTKYCANFYVSTDPRDKDADEEGELYSKKVWIYEFGVKIEGKIDAELKKGADNLGKAIFDPGPDGHNFIIKVKSTGGDVDYPDYNDSAFARKPSALGTDKEIKAILAQVKDLNEYINNKKEDLSTHHTLLIEHYLWTDALAREWKRAYGEHVVEADTKESKSAESVTDTSVEHEPSASNLSADEQALLDELKSI
jgi:hypothetical protein